MLYVLFYLAWLVYILLIASAFITDWRSRKIPNRLTYSAALLAVVIVFLETVWLFIYPVEGVWLWWSLISSLSGGIFAFGVMFFLFLRNGVGGGDVKLCGAAGLLVGINHIIPVMFYACLAGVAIGLGMAVWNGRIREVARRMFSWRELTGKRLPEDSMQPVPFGVAFAGGALWAALMPLFVNF